MPWFRFVDHERPPPNRPDTSHLLLLALIVGLNLAGPGMTQLVQPRPSRFVTPQAQHSLQPQGADPVLLAGHPPDRPEPQGQRRSRPLENRSCRHCRLVSTIGTNPPPATGHPIRFTLASRTSKPLRTAETPEILPTGLFRRKPPFQFHQRARVILHVPHHYPLW